MESRAIARLDAWIFEGFRASARDLGVYRILFGLFVLLEMLPVAPWMTHAPRAFFSPPFSAAILLSNFPSARWMTFLNVLLAGFASLLLVGWKTRLASLGTGITFLILKTCEYSMGKINHDILIVFIPLIMAFSSWGNAYSLDSESHLGERTMESEHGQWCLSYLALVIGVSMFTAGWTKLTSGWLDPTTYSTYGHLVSNYLSVGRATWISHSALFFGPSRLWKLADWFTICLEMSFIVACFSSSLLRYVMAVAVVFHLGTWVLFDIGFSANVIAYGAFVRYPLVVGKISSLAARVTVKCARFPVSFGWSVLISAFGLSMLAIWEGVSLSGLFHLHVSEMVLVIGALFVCCGTYIVLRTKIANYDRLDLTGGLR